MLLFCCLLGRKRINSCKKFWTRVDGLIDDNNVVFFHMIEIFFFFFVIIIIIII